MRLCRTFKINGLHKMQLGNRLEEALTLLSKCENNNTFADIGSDHAFFAIEAIKRGLAKHSIAADINALPLKKGRENAERQGFDVEFILSDGFDAFDGREISSAAICGMGGELIAKIILRSASARIATLILQPMSAQEELRKSLWESGFDIIEEKFVVESEKPYTVMLVKYSGVKAEFSYLDLYLGKERIPSREFAKYCEKTMLAAQKRRLGSVARGESTDEIDKLIAECQIQTTNL